MLKLHAVVSKKLRLPGFCSSSDSSTIDAEPCAPARAESAAGDHRGAHQLGQQTPLEYPAATRSGV